MPEITIYTNDGDCANGVAEINPFTVGDATDEWTLKFNNGTEFYSPSNVTMRVGHINGLPAGTYSNAFKWTDRAGSESIGSIDVTNNVPTLTFNTNPAGGVIGNNGVYILRGPKLDGYITSISVEGKGSFETFPNYSENPLLIVDGTITGSYVTGIGRIGPIFSSSPSGSSYAAASATIDVVSELKSLVDISGYFTSGIGGLGIYTDNPIGGIVGPLNDYTISFKMSIIENLGVIFSYDSTPPEAETTEFGISFGEFSIPRFRLLRRNYDSLGGTVSVLFEGIDLDLIEFNKEWDVTLSRSGTTHSLTLQNGTTILSDTVQGFTDTIGWNRWGFQDIQDAENTIGIFRQIRVNDGTSDIHYWEGNGKEYFDWRDQIGTLDGSFSGELFVGQGQPREVSSVSLINGGSGFLSAPSVSLDPNGIITSVTIDEDKPTFFPTFKANGNWARFEYPFMRDESGNNIIAATTLSPYSDGQVTDVIEYDHSTIVIRPEVVASALLTQNGLDWVGTMDPINPYVNERLSLRSSTQLDIQIRGDGRTLFQGQLSILDKIN